MGKSFVNGIASVAILAGACWRSTLNLVKSFGHDPHNEYPYAPKRIHVNNSEKLVRKLVPNLYDKKEIYPSLRKLKAS